MSTKTWRRWHSHLTPANNRGRKTQITNNHGLPVSPILEPLKEKPAREHQPLESLTSFRKEVAANAFANALATPVRQCNFTGARLPSHYLLPFTTKFLRHEDDKLVPYLAPFENSSRQATRAYAFNSRQLINRLGQKKTWQRLLGHELRFGLTSRSDYKWPKQIDEIILSQLRRSVVRKLAWVFKKPKANLVIPLQSNTEYPPSACILYLRAKGLSSSSNPSITGYELSGLLGLELLETLIRDTSLADNDALVLTQSYMTMSAHIALARLSTFLSSSDANSNSAKT
ncbi:hypothetical protein D6C77_04001 [Aureobasidium pullulans]|uniref:Uncharacterized protein n=1 Tax=Aureobasidium pullulans TaxID=5580 RepID=A0A4S8YDB5_AURPU|nr:hypothetical protein D6D21_04790 [Aureobasidium pullulans]THW48387.1 hypothetical protein D6D22_02220 [Aureobasidium pullulans]THW95345.1 hypothetical protein D6D15_01388 [Aureobasidium pullulans]THZ52961.1 hypothetical protein D6C90_00827 [Aureobasidium pullulans]TIA60632.1 hypothetical protein D6C77_04001 [Aureobasidium pullulans]